MDNNLNDQITENSEGEEKSPSSYTDPNAGYTEEDLQQKFSSLYRAFKYGAPPHAGMAPGIDRMLMLLTDEENIREVIAFPMNSNAQDVLLGAPNEVTEQQLREIHIKIR